MLYGGLERDGETRVYRFGCHGQSDGQPAAQQGHSVTGYNRTRAKAQWLVEKGMQWADSPRAVASTSDFIFAMVTNAAAIAAITEGPEGMLAGLSAGKIFIDMSTVSPNVSRGLAAKVRERARIWSTRRFPAA